MDRIERFDLDLLPEDQREFRELVAEVNILFAQIKELLELQERTPEIDLFPRLHRMQARTEQIGRELHRIAEKEEGKS
jgi:hypothetical protein